MTWFRVDDKFYDHPKMWNASSDAVALWVRSGCWSASNLTDGFVPREMVPRFAEHDYETAEELVRRRMWKEVEGGYQFHDWDEWNPTRQEVVKKRRDNAQRQRAYRERLARKGTRESRRSNAVSNTVTPTSPQVRGGNGVTREFAPPDQGSYDPLGRAGGAPDGPAAPASREVAERALKEIREKLAGKRRDGCRE